jgi:glycosyltransferase involved in cell wall biosynthesis
VESARAEEDSPVVIAPRVDVALDLPRIRQLSAGMKAYAEELSARLPRVAPDLHFATVVRTSALGFEEQVSVPLALRRTRARLVHFLSVYAPLFAPRPYVITIHDLIHLRFPEYFKRRVGPYYATVVRGVCARAARVITDDERTVEDLRRFLGVTPESVVVIPLGVDDAFLGETIPAALPRPYFLYAGNHREHKDLPTLFAAWQALDPGWEVDLLLTGDDDLRADVVRPRRERGELRFLGNVESVRLAQLYAGTVSLVHPALSEGFGLPMLEAAAAGAPVIACEDAVPSILRPFVRTFAARDVRALAALMAAARDGPKPPEAARRFARALTWDRCAERTAEVYRNVLEESRPG